MIGYSYQFSSVVVGVEGDIAGSTLSDYSTACGAAPGHVCGGNVYAISDLRARIGVPFGQFLPFIAGGLAVDDIHAYDSAFSVSGTAWEAGWTVGAGVDYQITPQFAVRLEYLHQGFGRDSIFNIVPGVPEQISTDTNVIRVGLIFNFNPPPPPSR